MHAADAEPVDLHESLQALSFLRDRTPDTTDEQAGDAFGRLADYRDGAIFISHWAGTSEWERHPVGDEIVMIVDGATTLTMLVDGEERAHKMGAGELVVVPQGTWHRFDTPVEVKVLTVTPQPTEHTAGQPDAAPA